MRAKSLQSCPTLCDPMDRSLLGSSVHAILQASVLERVAMPSSRGSSQLGVSYIYLHWQAGSLPLEAPLANESSQIDKVFCKVAEMQATGDSWNVRGFLPFLRAGTDEHRVRGWASRMAQG